MRDSAKYRAVLYVILTSLILSQGCATYHTVEIGAIEEAAIEIHRKSIGNAVKLGMHDGVDYFGRDIEFRADSTSIFHSKSSERVAYPNNDIKHIVVINRGKGGMTGFKIGFTIGFVTTALVYYIMESDWDDGNGHDWPLVMAFGLYGGAIEGFLWGLPIGWLIGSRDIYRLEHSDR